MVGGLRTRTSGAEAGRVVALVRHGLRLSESDVVTVAELRCRVPGCPPVETVVLILRGAARYRLRVFRPVTDVAEADLPPAWYLPALALDETDEGGCC